MLPDRWALSIDWLWGCGPLWDLRPVATVPGGWGDKRAPEGQGDSERQPSAEQADGVHDDERDATGAEPVGQPDRVTAGIGGEEACRDFTRCAAGEHLPYLQERGKGGEHAIGGRCGAEELGEHVRFSR